MLQLKKLCRQCHKPFTTRLRTQVYCSRACADVAHRGVDFAKRERPAPQRVRIRITRPISVWPEFAVELGAVYDAERYQYCETGHIMYVVARPGGRKTIVRDHECVEVRGGTNHV